MKRLWVTFDFEIAFDVDEQEELHEEVMAWFTDIRPDNLPFYEVSNKSRDE